MLTEDAYKIFKKYGFDVVSILQVGVYDDYDKLCDDLVAEFESTSASSIQE